MVRLKSAIILGAAAALAFSQAPKSTPNSASDSKERTKAGQRSRDLETTEVPAARTSDAPPPKTTIPRSYALVVGVSAYKNLKPEQNLQFAERDAQALFSILISTEGGNFPAENVHTLVGPKATLSNLRREVEQWLPSVTRDDDRVLIYFAGHGFVSSGQAYLAPWDFEPRDIATSGYPMAKLGEMIGSKIKGKWKVLLADACHSGAISPENSEGVFRGLLDLNKSMFVMSASRDREQSFESPDFGGGHGVFTYYVERGLSGAADESRDGIVTADELAEYVRTNVRSATQNRQNPVSDRGSFDPNMLLAFVPSNAIVDPPKEAKTGTLIFEANMDGVEVFLDEKSQGVVDKGKPLRIPGLAPGAHTIQGVKMGYEPDGPREQIVYPGQESTVTIRIRFARRRPKAAVDHLERGLKPYTDGGEANYRKAAAEFAKALEIDPQYSQAALYLARAHHALFENDESRKMYERAIAIDPDYTEARASYGGMLLDIGATDEAIRQLSVVVAREPDHALAHTQLAAAYRMRDGADAWKRAAESAERAIAIKPETAEPYFWLGDARRLLGEFAAARDAYLNYLKRSDFDSKLAGQLNYWVRGFLIGGGRKTRAAQRDIWKDLRSLAYFGLCDCERNLKRLDEAIAYCQKAISFDPSDPYIHYALGSIYGLKARDSGSLEMLATSSSHFRAMLRINPDVEQAGRVREILDSYGKYLDPH
ncbi:MAG: tetratricopeptide repeat protein [Bryobacteraceae bacterium]